MISSRCVCLAVGEPDSGILPSDLRYLGTLDDGTRVIMQPPECFVNSSDCPNTKTVGESDVALRTIMEGEELTSNYPLKYGPCGELLSVLRELEPMPEPEPEL
jgi:hypothetical protein